MFWFNECNEVVKELIFVWNLDLLLVKFMQCIIKYLDIIIYLFKYMLVDYLDRELLVVVWLVVIDVIDEINKFKKNYELVG